jgi:hypothetical protein
MYTYIKRELAFRPLILTSYTKDFLSTLLDVLEKYSEGVMFS